MTLSLRSGRLRSGGFPSDGPRAGVEGKPDRKPDRNLSGPQGAPVTLDGAPAPLYERLGIQISSDPYLLELDAAEAFSDHTGGVHSAVQFALAEAAAGRYLSLRFARLLGGAAAMIRQSEVKFGGPARGKLFARSRASRDAEQRFTASLRSRSRAVITISTEVVDSHGVVSLAAAFHCLVTREQPG